APAPAASGDGEGAWSCEPPQPPRSHARPPRPVPTSTARRAPGVSRQVSRQVVAILVAILTAGVSSTCGGKRGIATSRQGLVAILPPTSANLGQPRQTSTI